MSRETLEQNRLRLGAFLVEILGSKNVYFQQPTNIKMDYPCIRFERQSAYTAPADNLVYYRKQRYQLIVISPDPDHPVLDILNELPLCSYERHYTSDNLHHDVYNLYY